MTAKWIRLMQKRVASTSIGASTARGMGRKGTVKTARSFLRRVHLAALGSAKTEVLFQKRLNRMTERFRKHMPRGARHWGSCRKFLNIFLRGAAYNRFLCARYKLSRIEPWLEVPLDSQVAKSLHKESGGTLPKWSTVIGLSIGDNQAYQVYAEQLAKSKHTQRVHLDLLYWRRED